jgi:hypothetical protein
MLKALLRVVAFILLACFVIAFPISLVAHDVGALIFDPDTTKTLVRDKLLNSQLIAQLAQEATRQILMSGADGGAGADQSQGAQEKSIDMTAVSDALSRLTDADWQKITDLTAPTKLVDETVNQVIDAYTAWLNSSQPFPPLKLDLKVWKENTQNNASGVMTVLLEALPACDAGQVETYSAGNLQTAEGIAGSLQVCRPPEPYYGTLVANANLLIEESLKRAPDTIDVDLMTQNTAAPNELVQLKTSLTRVRLAVTWAWAVIGGLGALAVAAAASGFKSMLRWASWPLILSGGLVLAYGLGLQFFSLHFLDEILASALTDKSGALGIMGSAIAAGALDLVTKPLLLQGVITTGLGIGAILYARILARRAASPGIAINKRRVGL